MDSVSVTAHPFSLTDIHTQVYLNEPPFMRVTYKFITKPIQRAKEVMLGH